MDNSPAAGQPCGPVGEPPEMRSFFVRFVRRSRKVNLKTAFGEQVRPRLLFNRLGLTLQSLEILQSTLTYEVDIFASRTKFLFNQVIERCPVVPGLGQIHLISAFWGRRRYVPKRRSLANVN